MPYNTAEGGSNGTTVLTTNSGGASGVAFDSVTAPPVDGVLAFDNTHAAHGSLAYKFQIGATSSQMFLQYLAAFSPSNVVRARIVFSSYLTANPAASLYQLHVASAAAAQVCGCRINTSGQLIIVNQAGSTIGTMTSAIPLNAWFRVVFDAVLDDTLTNVNVTVTRYDNVDVEQPTDSVSATGATAVPFSRIRFGWGGTATTNAGPWWMDDLNVFIPNAAVPVYRPGQTWQRRFRHRQLLPPPTSTAVSAGNAPADIANAAGTANDPSPSVAPVTTTATATGVANNPTVTVGTNAPAGLASGTGTANNPSPAIAPGPSSATGTGLANNPTSKVAPTPTTATGTGTAFNPTVLTGSLALAGNATAAGLANNTTSKVAPVVGTASGTGTANNPTVTTGGATNAPAGSASGTGTANNPTVAVAKMVPAGSAAATGVASNASLSIRTTADIAAAVAAAFNPIIPAAVIDVTGRVTVTQTVASTVDAGGPQSGLVGVTQTNVSSVAGQPTAGGITRVDPTTDGRADVG